MHRVPEDLRKTFTMKESLVDSLKFFEVVEPEKVNSLNVFGMEEVKFLFNCSEIIFTT